jgi:hypothetical protein
VNDPSQKISKNKAPQQASQDRRLRAALRENLKRRRAQAKARAAREAHHGASHDSAGIAENKKDEG